jgi:hypothetical protein
MDHPMHRTRWSSKIWPGMQAGFAAAAETARVAKLTFDSFLCGLLHRVHYRAADEGAISKATGRQKRRDKATGNRKR